jgi:hypothetical protein
MQHEQLDVLSELAAPAPDQQPRHSRKGEIGKRKKHARCSHRLQPRTARASALVWGGSQPIAKSGVIWYSRARETEIGGATRNKRDYHRAVLTERAFWNPSRNTTPQLPNEFRLSKQRSLSREAAGRAEFACAEHGSVGGDELEVRHRASIGLTNRTHLAGIGRRPRRASPQVRAL